MKSRIAFLGITAFSCFNIFAAGPMTHKPVLLYSLYFEAPGENRYLPDGKFKDVMSQLQTEFDVRTNSEPLTAKSLADVNVLLIANPNDQAHGTNPPPHHVSKKDIRTLASFVERGGGLILMGNQNGHNVEVEDVNRLLAQFGLQFTNLYTDIKSLYGHQIADCAERNTGHRRVALGLLHRQSFTHRDESSSQAAFPHQQRPLAATAGRQT